MAFRRRRSSAVRKAFKAGLRRGRRRRGAVRGLKIGYRM